MAGLSYLVAVVVHNPWWTSGVIGETPIFNLLLLAYGAPVLLALVISRYQELVPRHWALAVAVRRSCYLQHWNPADLAGQCHAPPVRYGRGSLHLFGGGHVVCCSGHYGLPETIA